MYDLWMVVDARDQCRRNVDFLFRFSGISPMLRNIAYHYKNVILIESLSGKPIPLKVNISITGRFLRTLN
jgi:hypothetical protein